ncbi:MAG: MarR family transcriptional regulator [Chloroflexota bacterium]|nr:MarR family transcriptional regulator [Chloroflexota bacterium]
MAERASDQADPARALRFACSCASAAGVATDPWARVSQDGKLKDGTKELILNAIYRRPRTIAQLAQQLNLSSPAVHRHITEMLASELIREVDVPDADRMSPVERYYRPNFPVVLAQDRAAFQPVLEELAREFATTFRGSQDALASAFTWTSLPGHEERFEALLHYLYTTVARMAREQLEREGVLPLWPRHADGSRWVWWAEERLEGPRLEE